MENPYTLERKIYAESHDGLSPFEYAEKKGLEWTEAQLARFRKEKKDEYDREYPPGSMKRAIHEEIGRRMEAACVFGTGKRIGGKPTATEKYFCYELEVLYRIYNKKPYEE